MINNRSLFQVFIDNLTYPGQLQESKSNLYGMESPKNLKKEFACFMRKLEEQSKDNVQKVLNEEVAKCFLNLHVEKRPGRKGRSQFD